jgi:hypothetical protein
VTLPLLLGKVFIADALGLDHRAKVFYAKDLWVKYSKQKVKAPVGAGAFCVFFLFLLYRIGGRECASYLSFGMWELEGLGA